MSEEEMVSEQSVNSEANKPPRQLEADTPPLQGESLNDTGKRGLTAAPERAGEDARVPNGETPAVQAKTQGVRSGRSDGGMRVLERAAKAAARTGKRGDVHAYMRIRRSFV